MESGDNPSGRNLTNVRHVRSPALTTILDSGISYLSFANNLAYSLVSAAYKDQLYLSKGVFSSTRLIVKSRSGAYDPTPEVVIYPLTH